MAHQSPPDMVAPSAPQRTAAFSILNRYNRRWEVGFRTVPTNVHPDGVVTVRAGGAEVAVSTAISSRFPAVVLAFHVAAAVLPMSVPWDCCTKARVNHPPEGWAFDSMMSSVRSFDPSPKST